MPVAFDMSANPLNTSGPGFDAGGFSKSARRVAVIALYGSPILAAGCFDFAMFVYGLGWCGFHKVTV